MKVLVTGCFGFIGHHVCIELLKYGHHVIGIDICDAEPVRIARKRAIEQAKGGWFTCRRCDVRDYDDVADAMIEACVVVHLAAKTGVADSMLHGDEYIKTNIGGTDNVFRAAILKGVKRVVFASSSSVYGSLRVDRAMHESEAGNGLKSVYAVTKMAQELLADVYRQHGLNIIGLRFFSVYGPLGRPDNIITKAIRAALDKTSLPVYGEGKQKRDFTYVGHVARAVAIMVEVEKVRADIFNVGAGESVSVADVISIIEKAAGFITKSFQPSRQCDIEATMADTEAIGEAVGWERWVGIHEGIRLTIESEMLREGS